MLSGAAEAITAVVTEGEVNILQAVAVEHLKSASIAKLCLWLLLVAAEAQLITAVLMEVVAVVPVSVNALKMARFRVRAQSRWTLQRRRTLLRQWCYWGRGMNIILTMLKVTIETGTDYQLATNTWTTVSLDHRLTILFYQLVDLGLVSKVQERPDRRVHFSFPALENATGTQ